MSLDQFCTTRDELVGASFDQTQLAISGTITLSVDNAPRINAFCKNQQAVVSVAGAEVDLDDIDFSASGGLEAAIILYIRKLPYYETVDDLIRRAWDEPARYYIHALGLLVDKNSPSPHATITGYRWAVKVRELLANSADYAESDRVFFLTPDKLEIPLQYSENELQDLPGVDQLVTDLQVGAQERDQKLSLLKRNLREYLKNVPLSDRFGHFLRHFDSIYEAYHRDYLLWIGQAFTELEKTFEEKRLKLIGDLNGILASIQASILAVPVTALLVFDRLDFSAGFSAKNVVLCAGVTGIALIASLLLRNQAHTLDATSQAIGAIEADFERKHPDRKLEFRIRLKSLTEQEARVDSLLKLFRRITWAIAGLTWLVLVVGVVAVAQDAGRQLKEQSQKLTAPTPSVAKEKKP